MPGLAQCPIDANATFTYTFAAHPAGTSWYHSHKGIEYMDGLFGPLLISHRPESGVLYSAGVTEEHTLMFSDLWVTNLCWKSTFRRSLRALGVRFIRDRLPATTTRHPKCWHGTSLRLRKATSRYPMRA